jgi:hypothetical protein
MLKALLLIIALMSVAQADVVVTMTPDEYCMSVADQSGKSGIEHELVYDKCMEVNFDL